MERKEIFATVEQCFKTLLKNESLEITEELTETDIDGWDSIFQTTLVSELEKKYGFSFKLREIISWESVSDIIDSIEDHLS